jgi:hypothetical protein
MTTPEHARKSLGRRFARELRTPGRFRPNQPPVDPFEQGRELRRRHPHHAIPHLRPYEGAALEALVQ